MGWNLVLSWYPWAMDGGTGPDVLSPVLGPEDRGRTIIYRVHLFCA